MVFSFGIKLNLHFMCKGSSFAIFLHIFYNMPRPSTICHKWNHCLSCKIICCQKCKHCRCHRIPPRWSSDSNHIIISKIYRYRIDLRHKACLYLSFSLFNHIFMTAAVWLCCFDSRNICTCPISQLLCNSFRVSI